MILEFGRLLVTACLPLTHAPIEDRHKLPGPLRAPYFQVCGRTAHRQLTHCVDPPLQSTAWHGPAPLLHLLPG